MKTVYTQFLSNDLESEFDYKIAIDGSMLASWLDLSVSLSTLGDANIQLLSSSASVQPQNLDN